MSELAHLDATAMAELVRTKEVSPLQLVEDAVARIESLNPLLNAVIAPMYDYALAAARAEIPDGPFRGVPFLLKDILAAWAGRPLTSGARAQADHVPAQDSELVLRIKRAGLLVLGKTNTPEFGILPTTEPVLFGPTKNPWDLTRTTGGSSGGSAAAVAAGMVPMAHANDGGGSIRIPASCCGVFGLKPTRARNPLGPQVGDLLNGLVVEHAVTRSVRDSARLLDATQGPDLGAPYWAPPPSRPFVEEVERDPSPLRVAVTTHPHTGAESHPDCVAAVEDAARLCAELGHHVEPAAPKLDGDAVMRAFLAIWAAGVATNVDEAAEASGKTALEQASVEPLTWALAEMGQAVSASRYLRSIALLQQAARTIARFMADYDVWLTPTLAEPPVPLGSFEGSPENVLDGIMRAAAFTPFTGLSNVTGCPAMSVPLFWNAAGLPIGAHFAGRFGDEATLFALAAQLERARPWSGRRPPVCVA